MAYDYTLPDGSSIRVPSGTPASVAEEWARRDFPELYKATEAPTKQKEGFFANVGAGYKDLMANNALGIGAFGDEKAARDMRRAAAEEAKNVKTTTWEDVKAAGGIGNTLSTAGAFARDSLAGTLPYMAQTYAGAKVGALAGAATPLPGGALVGGALGAVGANLPALFGSNLARQDQENPNAPLNKTAAAAAAVPQAALDAASTVFLFGRALGVNKLAGEAINKLVTKSAAEVEAKLLASAQQSLLKAGAKGAAAGAAVEMPTEVAQQVLERWQAGLALTGPEANKEYEAAAAAAVAVGGGLGPIHGIQTRSAAQATLKERDRVTADAARADALQKDEAEKQKQAEYRKTPGYLLDLDARRQAAETQVKGLRDQINSLKDFKEGTAEFEQRKALGQQVKDAVKEAESIFAEYNPRKAEIAVLKEREGMTPDEYFEFKNYGIKPPPKEDPGAKSELGPDEAAAGAPLPSTSGLTSYQKPVDVVAQTQAVFEKALAGARFHAEQTGQDITAADGVTALARNPEAVKAAQFALDNKIPLKGFDASTSRMWLKEVLKEAGKLAEAAKVADARAETEAEAKRARFATQPTDATDPTEAWRQGIEQDNDVAGDLTRTGDYAYNGDAPSQQRLPGTPPPLEPGKVEAFAPGEYKPGTEITDPKTAHAHQAYTELRAKYERAMADYQRVADTGSPQAIEARKTLAALSRAMDEAARQLDPTEGQSTVATPKEISDSGIDDLLNRALEPAAGNGPPTLPMDLEQSVRRLIDTRSGLFQKFTAALANKFSLQQALGNIEDRKAVTARGQLVPTEDRWEAKRNRLREADNAQKQARSELIAASIEEIKKQRELAGKLPLAHSDADLANIISKRLDAAYADTSNRVPKEGPKTAPGLVDKDTEDKIKARMARVQGRISELEDTIYERQGPLTRQESDNIYAELRQLDDEQSRLQGSLREINREFDKVSKERQVALDRQLATVNARIRNMRSSNSANMRGELGRLKAARRSILERQSMGTSEAMLHEALQNIITNLTVNKNLPTRANAVKEGLRKGATGNVSRLRELVLGGRQFPGREVETGSTEFGEAYGLKSGEEQFKASKDDAALVQRMREEELAELNDAAKDPRYDAKTQERIDNAIAALYGRLNDPVTEGDVARAKERYKPETGESGDLFGENLPKDIDRAGSEYDAARDAADTGKKEFGQALGGMKNKSPLLDIANKLAAKFGKTASGAAVSTYKEAKARLDAIRAKLPALKKSQEDARSEVHAAVDAKVSNDAMEADARLKATQRTAAAVLQQMKQRRDAATGPAKVELSENMQILTALIRELREELRPQLASIRNEHGLSEQEIQDFYIKLMPKKPSGEALRNATERDTAATMNEVDKEMTSAALIDALERDDAASIREIERLLGKIDSMGEDGAASTGAALQAVQAKYDDLVEKIRLERDWAAKIKKDRAPTAKKIAAVEDAVSSIKQAVSEIAPNADAPMSAIAKMVVAARETYKQWQDALNKAMETIDALERHGVPDKEAKTDPRSTHFIQLAGKLQDDYYKQMQAIAEANTAKNPAALKAEEAAEKRYEESVERAGELQKRLEALYKPESRVDAKGLWPADKFGPAVEPPTPQVVRGTYGTAYAKDKSNQTEDARKAAADARTQRLAEGKAAEDKPAIEFNGQKEMTILVPEETSADVRFKLVEWLRAKGHVAAAEEIENDAAEVVIDNWIKDRTWAKENTKALKASIAARDKRSTVVVREALSEADIAKAQKAATAQFAAAVRMGERQTAIRPQRSKASSTLKTGAKRGRPTKDAEENTRLGLGEMSVGDVNAPDVESRVDKSTLFRTGQQADAKLTPEQAQSVIDGFLAQAPAGLKSKIKFYPSARDIPAKVMQELNNEGAISDDGSVVKGGVRSNGEIMIVGDAHENVADLLATLAHEVTGHYGVQKLLGDEGLNTLTSKLVDQGNVDDIARSLGLQDALDAARGTSETLGEEPRLANKRKVSEILAHLEERRPSETTLQKAGRFVRELMGAINAALTKMGLRSPYKITAADLSHILRQARRAALADGDAAPAATVFRKAKTAYANSDLEDAVGVMVGGRKDKLAEIRAHATGLEFRTRFIDAYAGIKEALKAGDPVKAVQVTYDLMNFAQRNHVVQQAVMFGTPTRAWWGKLHGKDVYKTEVQEGASLKNVSDMLGKVKGFGNSQATSDAFTLYALAKRAQTDGWDRVFADLSVPLKAGPAQAAEIEKENARRQKARAYADTLANDKDSPFKLVYKEYQDWNKGMLQFAQQAGIISEKEFRDLAAKQNYTPLFRADKFGNMVLEIDQGRDITVGRLADEPHMQKMLGGSGQVMDFFTASVRNASVIIDASLHNIASREAAMSLYAMGAAHPVSATEKGDNIVEFRGPDKDGKVDLQRFAVDTAGTAAGRIPTDLLVKGFAGVPASLPGFVRMMGVPAQVLRKAVTRNPLYMVRQLIRDPMSAYLTTGAKFNPVTDTLSEISKSLQGTADRTLDRRGITGGALFAENETDLERLQNEAKNNGNWWNIGYYMAALDHGAHAADAITRRNVYNGAIKEGASEIEATLAAYESMPFSKRGTSPSARYLNHMIPFLSAMIQGWDVMYRAAKGDMPLHERVNVRNKLLARGTMIAGITMMYAMANADDEDYKKANTSERLNNWFVRIPGMDNALKVPIPFELGIIFKMIPEAMVRVAMSDKDLGQEARDIGAALANMAPNLLMPQAMLPVTEAMLNRSFFTGRDIEGRALQNVDIGQRYDKNTSELSKALGFDFDLFGTQVGVSPKMLEYMASQYTGGLYGALAAVVDNVLPAGDKEKPDRTLAQMPLFKTVLLQEDAGGEVNRLYDKIEKFTRTEATFKKMIAEGDGEGAKRYAEDNREEFGKAKVASAAKAVLDKFSTMEKAVMAADWDGAKKKAALDNIKRIKSSLAEKYAAAL